jgi:hypothetical protein
VECWYIGCIVIPKQDLPLLGLQVDIMQSFGFSNSSNIIIDYFRRYMNFLHVLESFV